MYLISSVYKHSYPLYYSVVLLYWKLERSFFGKGSSVSKIKTNGEYYQKSDYRLLRINTAYQRPLGTYNSKCWSINEVVICCETLFDVIT